MKESAPDPKEKKNPPIALISEIEPKEVEEESFDKSWLEIMQEELR